MTTSRSSGVAALALALALLAPPAAAQTSEVGPPRQLLPSPEPIGVGPPPKAVPPAVPTEAARPGGGWSQSSPQSTEGRVAGCAGGSA